MSSSAETASAKSASTGLTGLLPDVSGIKNKIDGLESENAALKAEVEQLTADLAAAHSDRDDAQARAVKLAEAVDSGEPVEREPGDLRAGDLVLYRLVDVVTGTTISGPGVVARVLDGGLVVAPISPLPLTVTAEAVTAVPAEALG